MAGKSDLTAEDIKILLHKLDKKLRKDNIKAELTICGGCISVLAGRRLITDDIDSAKTISSHIVKYILELRESYNLEVGANKLEKDWLNDNSAVVVPENLDRQIFIEFSNLTNIVVYRLTDLSMFISKVKAARDKDYKDIEYYFSKLSISKPILIELLKHYKIILTEDELIKEWEVVEKQIENNLSHYEEGDKEQFFREGRIAISRRNKLIEHLYPNN